MKDPLSSEQVVLVNEEDVETGLMLKMEAHEKGLLHRAFSVFVFNTNGDLLLQQRALSKYHSPGLWSNTCCSHPHPAEDVAVAAVRRLKEEMGMDCVIQKAFHFIYRAEVDNNLIEHEYDHVFFGITDRLPVINPNEVQDWRFVSMESLRNDIRDNLGNYSEWLKIIFEKVNKFKRDGKH
ncbi:MAG TPA: isopentenyl-diphosphate Delta-isomerase [Sphingobacteriaceae bacterium]|nr:isopentenyl-diphosphate Delta-isomerase [Sphingobacteriaceae bacterium]